MKNWLCRVLPLALIAVPMVGQAVYISQFAVNVPFGDEWDFVPLLQASSPLDAGQLLARLWVPHNEHRILFPRLIFLALAKITGWDVVVEMYASLVVTGWVLVGLLLLYKKARCGPLWGFVPLAWLVFSIGQWENILWGWQLQIYLQVVGIILGIHFLSNKTLRSVIVAILCGTVASFSFNSGLLIWPVGLVCLAALRAEKRQLILWSLAGTLVVVAYYQGHARPSPLVSLAQVASVQPFMPLVFFLANVGAPLRDVGVGLSVIMGGYLIVLLFIFLYQQLRTATQGKFSEADVVLGSLVLFSLLASMAITVGRVGLGDLGWATSPRYTTITSTAIAGMWMLFIRHGLPGEPRQEDNWGQAGFSLFSALLSLLVIGLTVVNLHGIDIGRAQYTDRLRMKYALQTFEIQRNRVLRTLYPDPTVVRERASYLKDRHLSVFREPVNMLLLTSPEGGVPVGDILPDRPAVQTFKCPVPTLNDVEILLATYHRTNTSSFEIVLAEGDNIVTRQSWLSTQIKNNSWVHIVLPQPVKDCKGRSFVLRVESRDATPGNAITVWAYPRYYEGELLEPKDDLWADGVVGLELNAYSYGLVQ